MPCKILESHIRCHYPRIQRRYSIIVSIQCRKIGQFNHISFGCIQFPYHSICIALNLTNLFIQFILVLLDFLSHRFSLSLFPFAYSTLFPYYVTCLQTFDSFSISKALSKILFSASRFTCICMSTASRNKVNRSAFLMIPVFFSCHSLIVPFSYSSVVFCF